MSKPLNVRSGGCNPVSSDCVTYNGSELCDEIPICLGSSVTEVLESTMKEVCKLNNMLNVESFSLENTCFDNECGIKDFHDLINNVIVKLCSLIDSENDINTGIDSQNAINTQKFVSINSRLDTMQSDIDAENIRMQNIEHNWNSQLDTAVGVMNTKLLSRVLQSEYDNDMSSVNTRLNMAVSNSENTQLNLGTTQSVMTAISRIMGDNISMRRMLSDNRTYGQNTNWIANPSCLAEVIQNEWVVVDDILRATSAMFTDYEGVDCSAISLNIMCEAITATQIKIDFVGNIPAGFNDSVSGSSIEIYERNSNIPQRLNGVNIINEYYRTHTAMIIDLNGISAVNELTVRVTLRSDNMNNGNHCERIFEGTCLTVNSCPNVLYTPNYNSVTYQFTWNGSATIMEMQLYSSNQESLLARLTINANTENVTGTIGNLAEGTTYMARLVINGVPCEFKSFTTAAHACIEVPIITDDASHFTDDLTNPTDGVDGRDITNWINRSQNIC